MPTYEYACRSCDEHLELVQSFDDDPLTECPACGGALRKVFGAIGVVLKGSGFYRTDSRSSSSRPATTAGDSGSSSGSNGSDGSSPSPSPASGAKSSGSAAKTA